jgi:hypothetical protein
MDCHSGFSLTVRVSAKAVHPRQLEIGYHQVRTIGGEAIQCRFRRLGSVGDETGLPNHVGCDFQIYGIVVYYQDSLACCLLIAVQGSPPGLGLS